MPILPKQRDISPGDLLDEPASPAANPISRWISVQDKRMLVDVLRSIRRVMDTDQSLSPNARLDPGLAVRDRSGPVRQRRTEPLVVAVQFLNQGASIELEDVDLEPL